MALNVVVLVGGVGGAKLAHGLAQILEPGRLTIIVNTGDDFWHHGLRICPDMDTVMYTLGGVVDKHNGWGRADDTTQVLNSLQAYGAETWFRLGDRDLATHLLRTEWLRQGLGLTEITARLTEKLGVKHHILPMTDDPVATIVDTVEYGELDFQTYFVRHRWQPTLRGLRFDGIESAHMTPEVRHALMTADAILVGPSNPWLSIRPVLSVPGLADLLTRRAVPRIAITPIIQGGAVKGPASKLMAELNYEPSAKAVASYYGPVINGFVYDERDAAFDVAGLRMLALNTLMRTEADRLTVAREVLNWVSVFEMES